MTGWKKEVRDQAAHIVLGALIVAPAVLHPWGAVLSGLSIGIVREITEGYHPFSWRGLLDIAGWTVGGTLAALVLA